MTQSISRFRNFKNCADTFQRGSNTGYLGFLVDEAKGAKFSSSGNRLMRSGFATSERFNEEPDNGNSFPFIKGSEKSIRGS